MSSWSPLKQVVVCLLMCGFLLASACGGPDNFDPGSPTEAAGDDGGPEPETPAECVDTVLSTAFTAVSLALGIEPALVDELPNHVIFKSIFETIQSDPDEIDCPDAEVPEAEGTLAISEIVGNTGACTSLVDESPIGLVTDLIEFSLECTDYGVPLTDPMVTIDGAMGFSLVKIDPLLGGAHLEFLFGSDDLHIDCLEGDCPVTINLSIVVEFLGGQLIVWIDGCMTVCDDAFSLFGLTWIDLEAAQEAL